MPKPEKTGKEQANAPAVQTERERRAALPKYEGGAVTVTPEQRDSMLAALCTDDTLVLSGAVNSAASCNPYEGEDADRQRSLALRLLVELAPKNAVERLLIQQLIAADQAASACLAIGTYKSNDVNHRRKSMNLACQFMSVQARQIELLNKLRNGGQQRVVVEHISVEAGAQAVIGNVTRGEGGGNGR